MDDLGTGVVADMLSRLSTTSIVCFKGVCKTWYDISSHLNVADLTKRHSVAVYSEHSPNQLYIIEGNYLCDKDGATEDNQSPHITKFELPFITSGCSISASLSCNGLLLVSYFRKEVDYDLPQLTVCNPLIGNYVTLPVPKDLSEERIASVRCTLGFGFHPVSKQYKVLMNVKSGHKQRFYVLTLGTSDWRLVDGGSFTMISVGTQVVQCNGALHWVRSWRRQHCKTEQIVSFDLLDEKFDTVLFPKRWGRVKNIQLLVLGGALSYSSCYKQNIYIYSMTEYGVRESWTPKFKIRRDLTRYATPMFLLPSGKLFVMNKEKESWDCEPGELKYYREWTWFKEKETEDYESFVWNDLPCYSLMTVIEASLVWPFM